MADPVMDSALRALGQIDEYWARAGSAPGPQNAMNAARAAMGASMPPPMAAPAAGGPGWFARNLPSLTPIADDAGRAASVGGRVARFAAPVARLAGRVAPILAVPGVVATAYDEVMDPNSASQRATMPYRQAADAAGGLAGVLPRLQAMGVGTASIANQAIAQPLLRLFGSRVANEAAAPARPAPAAAAAPASREAAAAPAGIRAQDWLDATRGMTRGAVDNLIARLGTPRSPQSAADVAGYTLLRNHAIEREAMPQMTAAQRAAVEARQREELLGLSRAGNPMLNFGQPVQ